jgi:uncharacterized phosphosugar-binding protein
VTLAAPPAGEHLIEQLMRLANLVHDVRAPHADAMVTIGGPDNPVGPGSTVGAAAIVNAIKVPTAVPLPEQGAVAPVIARASVVVAERSRSLFEQAYREHARRLARAIDQPGGG